MDTFTLEKIEFDAVRQILVRYCSTSIGKEMARRLRPSREAAVVGRWLEQTTQMVRALREVGVPPFGGVSDIADVLDRAKPGGGADPDEYARLASALVAAANLKAYVAGLGEGYERLAVLGDRMETFDAEVRAIRQVIDETGKVRDDASEKLQRLRREIESITRQIHAVIYSYVRDAQVARLLQSSTVTLHGDRYVLPVRAENRGRLPGVVHRASNTGATVFIEPATSVELNNHLVDLVDDERREVQRLLNELGVRVQAKAPRMAATMRLVAALDVVAAKAQYAYQFDMTCPEISEDGPMDFHQARHPLLVEHEYQQERAGGDGDSVHRVVPIDLRLGTDFDVLVVTGSNTGGKTVALKTAALLSVMVQAGMHVPVSRGGRTRIFRDVYIDVGDEQSLQQSLSTFGAHITRIKYILEHANRSCLVLLDELGSGTDPDEGGAIGEAILDELLHLECLAMVTTHLGLLKAYAYNHERVDNASVEFDTATLRPTFRLHIGTPGESHAIAVARRIGLSRRVTSTAQQHVSQQHKQFRRAIQRTSVARRSAEEARSEAQAAHAEALTRQEDYQKRLVDLQRLQDEFETWLAKLSELRPGDELVVPALGRTGRLVRLELHRQIALVQVDGINVEVPLPQLMPDLGQQAVRKQIGEFRRQIVEEAQAAASARAKAEQAQEAARKERQEAMAVLAQHQMKARQFDKWLGFVGHMKPGDEVPIAIRPGKGKLLRVDLHGLRATVHAGGKEIDLPLQDLFPQTGPFAPREAVAPAGEGRRRGRRSRPQAARPQAPESAGRDAQAPEAPSAPEEARPMPRGGDRGRKAQQRREALLQVAPGSEVYVVPFNKRATLVRIDPERQKAIVSSGAFEMQLPLSDLEPVGGQG